MKIAKSLILSAIAVGGLTFAGAGVIYAASPSTSNPMSGLVNAIAQKFNLNPSDVQQVFDQQRQQMQQQMQANLQQHEKTFLDQAVKNGKLTQDQEDKIIAKQQELQSFMQGLQGKSSADRQSAIKTEMSALAQWAKDNNIPHQYLRMGFGRGPMMGGWRMGGRMHGRMMKGTGASTQAPTPASSS